MVRALMPEYMKDVREHVENVYLVDTNVHFHVVIYVHLVVNHANGNVLTDCLAKESVGKNVSSVEIGALTNVNTRDVRKNVMKSARKVHVKNDA